jgi:predicted transcriptional regulator
MPIKHAKISDQLRQLIEQSGMTRYQISKLSGVDQAALFRFLTGKDISTKTFDALGECLRLKLIKKRDPE